MTWDESLIPAFAGMTGVRVNNEVVNEF